jgi:hypothetical protein
MDIDPPAPDAPSSDGASSSTASAAAPASKKEEEGAGDGDGEGEGAASGDATAATEGSGDGGEGGADEGKVKSEPGAEEKAENDPDTILARHWPESKVLNKLVNWLIDDPEAKLTQADVDKKEEEKKMLKVRRWRRRTRGR